MVGGWWCAGQIFCVHLSGMELRLVGKSPLFTGRTCCPPPIPDVLPGPQSMAWHQPLNSHVDVQQLGRQSGHISSQSLGIRIMTCTLEGCVMVLLCPVAPPWGSTLLWSATGCVGEAGSGSGDRLLVPVLGLEQVSVPFQPPASCEVGVVMPAQQAASMDCPAHSPLPGSSGAQVWAPLVPWPKAGVGRGPNEAFSPSLPLLNQELLIPFAVTFGVLLCVFSYRVQPPLLPFQEQGSILLLEALMNR